MKNKIDKIKWYDKLDIADKLNDCQKELREQLERWEITRERYDEISQYITNKLFNTLK